MKKIGSNIVDLAMPRSRFDVLETHIPSPTTMFYGLIIGYHPGIEKALVELRKSLGIEPVVYAFGQNDVEKLTLVMEFFDKHNQISDEVAKLLAKYQLWDNWQMPIELMLCTGVLPLARENPPIAFHNVIDSSKVVMKRSINMDDLTNLDQLGAYHYFERMSYPAIHITERLRSPNELIKWVKENWNDVIQPELQKIPPRLKQRADIERLAVGLWLWDQMRVQHKKWQTVEDEVGALLVKDTNFFGNEDSSLIPDAANFSKLINSAEETMRQFYPYKFVT